VSVDVIAHEERDLDRSGRLLRSPMVSLDGGYAELTAGQATRLAGLLTEAAWRINAAERCL
jgi:hypothetical protein